MIHEEDHVMLSRQNLRSRQIQLLLNNDVLPVIVNYRLCSEIIILNESLVDLSNAYV